MARALMGRLKILTSDGHEECVWNANSPSEVQAAREKFEKYLREDVIAFKTDSGSKEAIPIRRFDPAAEEIFVLGLAGGG
ncbi:MAG TPA: hypothetical protein VKF36_00105 [Syntrophorhabdales bacterium]|nr:hypothetical protein [Syntrophorhabdales bacterium]